MSDQRRKAVIHVAGPDLARLFGVPDDVRIVHVIGGCDPLGISILVEGDRFDPVPDNAMAPLAPAHWQRRSVLVGGKTYARLEWDGE